MTRRRYLILNAAVLIVLVGVAKMIEKPLLNPALMWIDSAPKPWFLLPGSLIILWLAGAPLWSWATMRRLRTEGRSIAWGAAPAALGLGTIVLAAVAELYFPVPGAFGPGPAGGDISLWPEGLQAGTSGSMVENIVRNHDLLNASQYMMIAAAGAAVFAFVYALMPSARR